MSYTFSSIEADWLGAKALEAATQLDRFKRRRSGDLNAVAEFANAVAHFAGIETDAGVGTRHLDPSNSEILSSAVAQAFDKNVSSMDALNRELADIVARLRHQKGDMNSIDRMQRFCLEIHNLILKGRACVGLHERGAFDYEYIYS